jgi:uncharacterized protein (TIGR02145 family)
MKLLTRLKFLPVILIGVLFLSSCEKDKKSGLPTDGDGNEYDTFVIGTQVWLSENLKTTKYITDISIPFVTDNNEWASKTSAAYCWYNNDIKYKNVYGALYNWYIANSKQLCPVGYHVPNEADWKTLINYLGGEGQAGGKLKESGATHWQAINSCADDVSGFNARGGGARSGKDGTFGGLRQSGVWWALKAPSSNYDLYRIDMLYYLWEAAIRGVDKTSGMSIRCVKNN